MTMQIFCKVALIKLEYLPKLCHFNFFFDVKCSFRMVEIVYGYSNYFYA